MRGKLGLAPKGLCETIYLSFKAFLTETLNCRSLIIDLEKLKSTVFKLSKTNSFSIVQTWHNLIKEKKLFGYKSENEFLHVTNLEIYNKLLKDN